MYKNITTLNNFQQELLHKLNEAFLIYDQSSTNHSKIALVRVIIIINLSLPEYSLSL